MSDVIRARVEEAACVARRNYPMTQGCPFPEGALLESAQVRLNVDGGDELPLQTTVLTTWPDGSIKWLLLDTQMDLRAKQVVPVTIEYGEGVSRKEVTGSLSVSEEDGGVRAETGALTMELNGKGLALFADANGFLDPEDGWQMRLLDETGTVYTGQVETLEVEEQNALRAVVKAGGGYVSEDGVRPMSWLVRLTLFAHQPFVKMHHTFVHDQDEPLFFKMREMRFSLPTGIGRERRVMLGSPTATTHIGEDFGVQDGSVRM